MKQRLINHIESIQDPALRRTCESIPTFDKFFTCPASLGFHHACEGGLLAHTVEVCDIISGMNGAFDSFCYKPPDMDILIAAALWHDVMKVEEYERSETAAVSGIMWRHTDTYSKRIGHICGGAALFQKQAWMSNVDTTVIEAVTHCILAHHGRKEWGSPVEPQTLEALILHQADMLSAQYGATK
jgi:3'-5' exoribonuclease